MVIKIRIFNGAGKIIRRRTTSGDKWRKIYSILASAAAVKWYIRVDYGYNENVFGKRVMFKNEAVCHKLSEAKKTLSIFMEK